MWRDFKLHLYWYLVGWGYTHNQKNKYYPFLDQVAHLIHFGTCKRCGLTKCGLTVVNCKEMRWLKLG